MYRMKSFAPIVAEWEVLLIAEVIDYNANQN